MTTISQRNEPARFTSSHYLDVPLGDNKVLLTMTGIVEVAVLQATNSSSAQKVTIALKYPDHLRSQNNGYEKALMAEHWTIMAAPASTADLMAAPGGDFHVWSVDAFWMPYIGQPQFYDVCFEVTIATAGSLTVVSKIAYQISIYGHYEQVWAPGPQ